MRVPVWTRICVSMAVLLFAAAAAAQAGAVANAQAASACPSIVTTRPTIVPAQRYKAGDAVPPLALDEPLRWIECPAPEFPSSASRGARRLVFLSVTVSETGAVTDLRPRASADAEGFFDAAVAAVRRWRATAPRWKTLAVRSTFAADIAFDPNAASAPKATEPPPAATPARVETPPARQGPAPAPAEIASAPPPSAKSPAPAASTPTSGPVPVTAPPQPEPKPAPVEKSPAPANPPAATTASAAPENKPVAVVEAPRLAATSPPAATPRPASPTPVAAPPAAVTEMPAAAVATPPSAAPAPAHPLAPENSSVPTRPCPQFFILLATSRAPQNYRAGDMVPNHLLDSAPAWVQCPWPDFNGVAGRVAMLIVVLDENGAVREVRPRGHRETDAIFRRAKGAVTNWRVNPPPRYKAQPVWTSTAIDIQNDGRVTQGAAPVTTPALNGSTPSPASSTTTEPFALPASPRAETAPQQTPSRPPANETPFAVEYYYKTKWGFADEFWRLFLKNHWPVLRRQIENGRILEVRAEKPVYHPTEDGRWDYRVTIVFRSTAAAFATVDTAALERQLYPDQETFRREEQRRFELLLAHWDVPIASVALNR